MQGAEKASLPMMAFWLPGGRSWRYTPWFSTHNPLGGAKGRWKISNLQWWGRYCRDLWNSKGDLVGFLKFGLVGRSESCASLESSHHSQIFRWGSNSWTFQDMSSEYTGIIGVGTADDGGAEFEDLWLHSCAMSPGIFQRQNRENQTEMFGTMLHSFLKPS